MTTEIKKEVKDTLTSIEFTTLDGESFVNSWNNIPALKVVESSGHFVTVTYEIPKDNSATAALFALIGGADLSSITTHRSNRDGEVYLTIRHNIDSVQGWEISSSINQTDNTTLVDISYYVESSMVLGENEVTTIG